jgi:hypothetical protein
LTMAGAASALGTTEVMARPRAANEADPTTNVTRSPGKVFVGTSTP